MLLGLPPFDDTSSSLPGLSFEIEGAFPSTFLDPKPSFSTEDRAELMVPDGVVSRFLPDMGREGKAVLAEPDSRWTPADGVPGCDASLISTTPRQVRGNIKTVPVDDIE